MGFTALQQPYEKYNDLILIIPVGTTW